MLDSLAGTMFDALNDAGLSPILAQRLTGSILMAATIAAVAAIFYAGIAGMRSVGGRVGELPTKELARIFVHSFIPIALAYLVAHYFTLVLYQEQAQFTYLLNDPLGEMSNLFGISTDPIDYKLVSANAVSYIQVAALVIGHAAALVIAHDRAVAMFGDSRIAARSQYWMLALMVGFTTLGPLPALLREPIGARHDGAWHQRVRLAWSVRGQGADRGVHAGAVGGPDLALEHQGDVPGPVAEQRDGGLALVVLGLRLVVAGGDRDRAPAEVRLAGLARLVRVRGALDLERVDLALGIGARERRAELEPGALLVGGVDEALGVVVGGAAAREGEQRADAAGGQAEPHCPSAPAICSASSSIIPA